MHWLSYVLHSIGDLYHCITVTSLWVCDCYDHRPSQHAETGAEVLKSTRNLCLGFVEFLFLDTLPKNITTMLRQAEARWTGHVHLFFRLTKLSSQQQPESTTREDNSHLNPSGPFQLLLTLPSAAISLQLNET